MTTDQTQITFSKPGKRVRTHFRTLLLTVTLLPDLAVALLGQLERPLLALAGKVLGLVEVGLPLGKGHAGLDEGLLRIDGLFGEVDALGDLGGALGEGGVEEALGADGGPGAELEVVLLEVVDGASAEVVGVEDAFGGLKF